MLKKENNKTKKNNACVLKLKQAHKKNTNGI